MFLGEGDAGKQYQELYNSAASVLAIQPTTGKGQLFQVLSNIFSRNLIESDGENDTLIKATKSLQGTLNNGEINTKDYFDISLYASLILKKMIFLDEKLQHNVIPRAVLENSALYQIYTTIFHATQRYVDGIADVNKQTIAQKSLVTHFYIEMLESLVVSLFGEYMENVDGKILLKSSFLYRGDPKLSSHNHDEILSHLTSVHRVFSDMFQKKIRHLYGNNESQTRIALEASLARLQGFLTIADSKNYRQYQENPFLAEGNSVLPRYSVSTHTLVTESSARASEAVTQTSVNTPILPTQNAAENRQIAAVLSHMMGQRISEESVKRAKNGYVIEMFVTDKRLSFIYDPSKMMVSSLHITAPQRSIRVIDTLSVQNFRALLLSLPSYEARIQKISQEHPETAGKNVSILIGSSQIHIDGKVFALVTR